MIVSTVAFLLWAFSLPHSPFETMTWYRPSLGAVVLLAGTTVVGLVAPLLTPRGRDDSKPMDHTYVGPGDASTPNQRNTDLSGNGSTG